MSHQTGIWAVINTSGLSYRGRFDQQDVAYWDAMLKTNVIGVLRTARIFQGLLRNTGGRIINIGSTEGEEAGLVAYTATRYAVEGASNALRQEFAPLGIKIVTINPRGITPDLMFATPKLKNKSDSEISLSMSGVMEYQPVVLSRKSLQILDIAISTGKPHDNYTLLQKGYLCNPLQMLKIV